MLRKLPPLKVNDEVSKASPAHYFSSKDREEAISERKRIMQLMDFISAHGLSVNDVNAFVSEGKIANVEIAPKVFDNIPSRMGESPKAREANISNSFFFGGYLVPISCVGEAELPERATHSPVKSPMLVSTSGKKSDTISLNSNSNLTSKVGFGSSSEGGIPS